MRPCWKRMSCFPSAQVITVARELSEFSSPCLSGGKLTLFSGECCYCWELGLFGSDINSFSWKISRKPFPFFFFQSMNCIRKVLGSLHTAISPHRRASKEWDIPWWREGLGKGENGATDRVIMYILGCYFSLKREDEDMLVCLLIHSSWGVIDVSMTGGGRQT